MSEALDRLSINTVRGLAIDAVQAANSGHPGLPLGAAAMGYAIFQKHLRHNPLDPAWVNRDRFVFVRRSRLRVALFALEFDGL
jgi:transketolase